MNIKVKKRTYEEVCSMTPKKRVTIKTPNILFRTLVRLLSVWDLWVTRFSYRKIGMERLQAKEPCLILMNHSSFIDLKIASKILYPRAYNIVCTSDGFVGKNWLMRQLGCIPTQKFVIDFRLVRELITAVKKRRCSVLMYPEASYSFDGTATPLPESVGKFVKKLGVPLIMIRTFGAFGRDPLYNGLQRRRVRVSAEVEYLMSPEQIADATPEAINEILTAQFGFDNFRWQQEHQVRINEPFRADGLNRVLYKCPHCHTEGGMNGRGITLTCHHCGAVYTLTEYGALQAEHGEGIFTHVPDWYRWQRDCVRKELRDNTYRLDIPVDIAMLVDTGCLYQVGEGRLIHTKEGFSLTGCDGQLTYTQAPNVSYSLYADYFWYEIGDVICIGDAGRLYYCFPKAGGDVVAKTRLATEELYKLTKTAPLPN